MKASTKPQGPQEKLSRADQGKTLRRLTQRIFRGNSLRILGIGLALFLSTLASLATSLSLKYFMDHFFLPNLNRQGVDLSPFYEGLLLLALVYALGVFCAWMGNRFLAIFSQDVMKGVRDEMFAHLQTLPIRYFDGRANGDIMSLFSSDTDTLYLFIQSALPQILTATVQITSTFVAMLVLSPLLTGLSLLLVLVQLTVVKSITRNTGKYYGQQQERLAHLTGFVNEHLGGQRVVKLFHREEEVSRAFREKNLALMEASVGADTYASRIGPVIGNTGNLFFVAVAVVGGFLVNRGIGGVTVGVIAAYLQFTRTFNMPFMTLAQQANTIVQGLAGAKRIFDLLDEAPEADSGVVRLVAQGSGSVAGVESVTRLSAGAGDSVASDVASGSGTSSSPSAGSAAPAAPAEAWAWVRPTEDGGEEVLPLRGEVCFQNMNFGYTEDRQILYDLNFCVQPGQKVAFVGSTGAGKTTITNLINRFYDVEEGTILYDGLPLTQIRKPDLRRSLGMVLQDTYLFSGTIAENIRYGKLDATDEEVVAAARLAHADSFIRMLPKGYDTVLSRDGEELSEGQRQLLAIARAAIADPPVLILDEATSSIDTRTEALVQKGMDNLMKGRTVFVIAHRLSTVRNSDLILVLEQGRIVERGNHDSLLAERGLYWQLASGQRELD